MTSPEAFLTRVVTILNASGVPFMITGSTASTVYGQPRATNDVDFVIDPTPEQLDAFVARIPSDMYLSREAARSALAERGMFNVIDTQTSWKADLIVRKDRPFSREEFARRKPTTLFGCDVFVVSPEDSILSKLEWARAGGSEQQLRDAASIAARTPIDLGYLRRQARELGIGDLLEGVLSSSKS